MRKLGQLLFAMLIFISALGAEGNVEYISPIPGSILNLPTTSIAIRPRILFEPDKAFAHSVWEVTGSKSGVHHGKIMLSDDHRTIIFAPTTPFDFGERVSVKAQIEHGSMESTRPLNFHFTIAERPDPELQKLSQSLFQTSSDFPAIRIIVNNNPAPGNLFLSNFPFDQSVPNTPFLMILDPLGRPVFSRQMPARSHDFKVQSPNLLTYFDHTTGYFMGMDSLYCIVDSFKCGNGYTTDEHELRVLPNGHALLMSYDPKTIRMDTIVPGGQPNASVIGLVIQELDLDRNVVFQWRSWDHFEITDATHEDFTLGYIDYVHGNALELDRDGNILLSSRHMDEITKIDRSTGEIIWRLGGRHNQFTFINDSLQFSHQHDIRRLNNGHITLFDNGNFHVPPRSRAVEYAIDEVSKTVTQVWEYQHAPTIYGAAMGNVQRLANGNTLICWGSTNPTVTEVNASGQIVYEMSLPQNVFSYRVYKFDWPTRTNAVADQTGMHPADFNLGQNYPNPFNPTTTIEFDLPASGETKLIVYNVTGQEIATLVNHTLDAGRHEVTFDGRNLPSGVYYYKLKFSDKTATRKFVLLR